MGKKVTPLVLELQETLREAVLEAEKFDNGNKAAGGRMRKFIPDILKKIKVIKAVSLGKPV